MQSDWEEDVAKFSELIKANKGRIVVYTGAGISTSASIPDYRGTNGLWTRQLENEKDEASVCLKRSHTGCDHKPKPFNRAKSSFKPSLKLRLPQASLARPTFTHMAIKVLVDQGYIRHVVSQNVDGLHMRSGLKRECLSELHGNLFIEQCIACGHSVLRTFDVAETTARSNHLTGRICPRCRTTRPIECLLASGILHKAAQQLCNKKSKSCSSNEPLMLGYRKAARKLVHSFQTIRQKAIQHLPSMETSQINPSESITMKTAPLLRDVVVHFFEKQPEMGLAEIYRIQTAIEAIHGRKTLQDAIHSIKNDVKTSSRGRKRSLDEPKHLTNAVWFKRFRPALKHKLSIADGDSKLENVQPLQLDDSQTAAKLIIVIGSSLTVLRNYNFLWPHGLGRCIHKKSDTVDKKSTLNGSLSDTRSSNGLDPCRLVIINLQPTCKDGLADLVFRAPCDELFRIIMTDHLKLDVPQYDAKRDDPLLCHGVSLIPEEELTRTRPDIPFSYL